MIGKTIAYLLKDETSLTAIVGTKIFPYVVNEKTDLPFVTYQVKTLSPAYDKSGWNEDACTFSVRSFASDYNTLQQISQAVRSALELKMTGYGSQTIRRIYLIEQYEGYSLENDSYVNELVFKTQITGY